jgi:hypothetical protein
MQVTSVAGNWPECSARERSWFTPDRAVACIEDFGLRELIRSVAPVEVA